jgi:hypothetical protein
VADAREGDAQFSQKLSRAQLQVGPKFMPCKRFSRTNAVKNFIVRAQRKNRVLLKAKLSC